MIPRHLQTSANTSIEEFGPERLTRLLLDNRHRPAGELVRMIVDAIHDFVGDSEPSDDMTMVVVKRMG